MTEDNKKLIKYLGIIFIVVLITYKIPHDSYSIIQYIIRPIKHKNGVLYLSGVIPFILLFIGIRGLFALERVKGRNKLLLFLLITMIIMPMMKWSLDCTRTNYHWLKRDALKAVDVVSSNVSLVDSDDELTIQLRLELINYSRDRNKFKVRMYLPRTLREYTGKEFYEFENEHVISGGRNVMTISEEKVINLKNQDIKVKLLDSEWYLEDLKYELYNEDEVAKIIKRGL